MPNTEDANEKLQQLEANLAAEEERVAIQARFTEKLTRSEDCNDGFLALLGNDSELDLALLDVKNRVRNLSL
jgi:hypothetical protein